jgi:hypothetical protein
MARRIPFADAFKDISGILLLQKVWRMFFHSRRQALWVVGLKGFYSYSRPKRKAAPGFASATGQ